MIKVVDVGLFLIFCKKKIRFVDRIFFKSKKLEMSYINFKRLFAIAAIKTLCFISVVLPTDNVN